MNALRICVLDRKGTIGFSFGDDLLCALLLILCGLLSTSIAWGQTPSPQALAEINYLQTTFGVPINQYDPAPGNYSLAANKSFTAAMLPGKPPQSNPPQLGSVPQYSGFSLVNG